MSQRRMTINRATKACGASAALWTMLIGLATATPADAGASRELRYSVLASHGKAGTEVDRYDGNRLDSEFEFNDRGRGPRIHAQYRFASDGLPTQVDVSGVNYLKVPVDEHLVTVAGSRHWHGASERGESAVRAFYLSNDGPAAAELAALVRALARDPGRALSLLPGGEARLETVADATVSSHGKTLHVRGYAVTGLGFTPAVVWLDDAGQLFAQPSNWFGIVREGWEDASDTLIARQAQAEDRRYARLASELSRTPRHPLAIEHVRVFDAERAVALEEQTVVVRGARIATVGPAESVAVPLDAERIDGRGRTVLPGLFDLHVHLSAQDGILHIAGGVTAVRDLGNDPADLTRLTTQWDNGTAIGPTVWKAGLIDGRGPYQAPAGAFADSAAEVEAAVNRYADSGYVQIKVYSSLKPELVPVVVAAAHRRGLRVSGHVPQGLRAADFVAAGADELQHINFVFLNFLAPIVHDTRTPERFSAVAEHAAEVDLDGREVAQFIALLRERHVAVDVTLATFESMFLGRPGQVAPGYRAVFDRLPAQVRRGAYDGSLPGAVANDRRYRESYAALQRMTRKLYEAGVPVLVGTDDLAGFMLHRELELQVEAGIPAAQVLQSATIGAARLLHADGERGSLQVGKRADLVLVEGDPTREIGDVRRARLVLKAGVAYDPARLYEAIGVAPSR
ncbi:MAG: amidohydrolase family protein [Proteobacteria bacterium]|nr:amidohydrolase family protein [Pseudomonadota bacterium]